MSEHEFDPWAQTSGLIDDVDVTFVDCRFGTRSDYADGIPLLFIADCRIEGEDGPEEQELIYPCGKGWESAERGELAVREDGRPRGFNKNSGYGMLIAHALDCGAPLKERSDEYGPMRASIWNGLTFHMKRKTISFGGEIGERERLLPVKFVGEAGKSKAGKTRAAAKTSSDDADSSDGLRGALKAKLLTAARTIIANGGTHDDFVEEVWSLVENNTAAEAAVLDSGPGSIWAQAQD
ncbi:MAG: hypothetical protein KatS3mg015_2915 [Fimbriimonadales bacterium]|nr:MAG: hypothetical protein KatS3mg015_2915 [Fimbriimonadales bacterium]